MRLITSLSPKNLDRQDQCITTWEKYATEIIAVQPEEEIEQLSIHYSNITFVATDKKSDIFESNAPRIYSLIEQCPGVIINADIEIADDSVLKQMDRENDDILDCAVRFDYTPGVGYRMHRYGIDVFRISNKLKDIYQDLPFGIGQPGWDYYLLLEAHRTGFRINCSKERTYLHLEHPVNWQDWKLTIAQGLLERHYGMPKQHVTKLVLRLTGRR